MNTTPKVGQTLYSLNIGNASRHTPQVLTPVIVRKVGRKYFLCSSESSPCLTHKYHIHGWREECSGYQARSALYITPQKWEDDKEISAICEFVNKQFNYGKCPDGMTLSALRAVKEIIEQCVKASTP